MLNYGSLGFCSPISVLLMLRHRPPPKLHMYLNSEPAIKCMSDWKTKILKKKKKVYFILIIFVFQSLMYINVPSTNVKFHNQLVKLKEGLSSKYNQSYQIQAKFTIWQCICIKRGMKLMPENKSFAVLYNLCGFNKKMYYFPLHLRSINGLNVQLLLTFL